MYDLNACASFNQGLIKGVAKEHFEPLSKKAEKVKITSIDSKDAVRFLYKKKDEAAKSFTLKKGESLSRITEDFEFTDEEMELLDFAAALVKDPNHVPDEIYEPLQARYDEETLVLIVTTAVLTLANNYWNNIVGTPIDDYLHDGHYVERELDIQKAASEQK